MFPWEKSEWTKDTEKTLHTFVQEMSILDILCLLC